jgi:hypothetical protein
VQVEGRAFPVGGATFSVRVRTSTRPDVVR